MNHTRIGELRKGRGWTQERLADESGVAVRTVQRLESGKDASLDTISLIANALEVSVKDLFVSVESGDFASSVDQLNIRQSSDQRSRDAATQGHHALYRGVGILVTIAALALGRTGIITVIVAWLIALGYWTAGRYVFRFVLRSMIDPRLDRRYPLSTPKQRVVPVERSAT